MTRPNEYKAYFSVTGDFDPIEITKLVGIQPSETWKKGDRNERTRYERKFSRWSLNSRLNEFAPLEDQIADVLAQMEPSVEAICGLRKTFSTYMQLVGWFHTDYPGMHFDEKLISGLARFQLSVDFDFYYMYSDRREDS
jgi:hypothetical protein